MQRNNFSRFNDKENRHSNYQTDKYDRNASRDSERSQAFSGRPGGAHAAYYEK